MVVGFLISVINSRLDEQSDRVDDVFLRMDVLHGSMMEQGRMAQALVDHLRKEFQSINETNVDCLKAAAKDMKKLSDNGRDLEKRIVGLEYDVDKLKVNINSINWYLQGIEDEKKKETVESDEYEFCYVASINKTYGINSGFEYRVLFKKNGVDQGVVFDLPTRSEELELELKEFIDGGFNFKKVEVLVKAYEGYCKTSWSNERVEQE